MRLSCIAKYIQPLQLVEHVVDNGQHMSWSEREVLWLGVMLQYPTSNTNARTVDHLHCKIIRLLFLDPSLDDVLTTCWLGECPEKG